MPSEPAKPRRRRWWVRLLCWGLATVSLVVVSVGGAAWWVWQHPTESAKWLLRRVDSPLRPDVGKLHIEHDAVRVDSLTLVDPVSGTQVLSLDEAVWKPEVGQLKTKQYGSLKLKGLSITASKPLMQRLERWMKEARVAKSESTGVRFTDISLDDATVSLAATETMPPIELKLSQHATKVNFADPARPSVEHFDVTLSDVRVGEIRLPKAGCSGWLRDGTLHMEETSLSNGKLSPTPELLALLASQPPPSSEPSIIQRVELGKVTLVDFALASGEKDMPVWWPPVSGRVTLGMEGLNYDEKGGLAMGALVVEVKDFVLAPPTAIGHLAAERIHCVVEKLGADGMLKLRSVEVNKPVVNWEQDLESFLLGSANEKPAMKANDSPGLVRGVTIDALSLMDAKLSFTPTQRLPFEGRAGVDVEISQLTADERGLSSAQTQSMTVRDVTFGEAGKPPYLTAAGGRLGFVPDDWAKSKTIQSVALTRPVLTAHPETVSWFAPSSPATAAAPEVPDPRVLNFNDITISDGTIDVAIQTNQRIEVRSSLDVTTSSPLHHLKLTQLDMQLPNAAKLPVVTLDEVNIDLDFPSLLKGKRLAALKVKGGHVDVGDALLSLGASTESATETRHDPPTQPDAMTGWRLGELAIDDTAATLYHIAPGLPPMSFAIDYHASELPLSAKELAGSFVPQKMEFSGLSIRSPVNSSISVADLPGIFVTFTLDGLFKQRIDKIDIISPSLFVGEDLFWYVDWCRKYASGEDFVGPPAPSQATTKTSQSWQVDTLQVSNGKLIIAPKGHPLAGIPRPFPFSFVSKLESGKIEAELEVPSDDYEWADPPVKLQGLSGHVLFQVPIKGVDNNLTEVFKVQSIRWKELHIDDADLSVTYDSNGIYGKFNGRAYEGYVNGAFDVYMDSSYSWDGWLSGKNVRSTEITKKLCPEYFLLDGKVDLVVVAQGNQHEVYQCDVKFNNSAPGKFSITALNDMLKSLPDDLDGYQSDAIRIGMETLRDFDYDKVAADARFYGREGKAALRITGPAGSRNFDVNVFDHRLRVDKSEGREQAAR